MKCTRVNTSIMGHGAMRNGVIQTGAVALLLGAALVANSAHAAENVEREDAPVQPGEPATPARPARPAVPASPATPAQPRALPESPARRLQDPRNQQRGKAARNAGPHPIAQSSTHGCATRRTA